MLYWKARRQARYIKLPFRVALYRALAMQRILVANWRVPNKASRTARCLSKTGHPNRSMPQHREVRRARAQEGIANEGALARGRSVRRVDGRHAITQEPHTSLRCTCTDSNPLRHSSSRPQRGE